VFLSGKKRRLTGKKNCQPLFKKVISK